MIQLLHTQYSKAIAWCFLFIFYISGIAPSYGAGGDISSKAKSVFAHVENLGLSALPSAIGKIRDKKDNHKSNPLKLGKGKFIGGPSQPEMSSFKPVGTDNMVNLFTGDFSYNIPLLDVGGYPVNIYYNGNPGVEQEASWVGLGWNINPGNINRNMRGVPDDFNGEDQLIERQNMKPNKTFGVRLGADFEFSGIKDLFKVPFGADLGVSFNNYLGPAVDLGIKGGLNFMLGKKVGPEKSTGGDTTSFPFNPSLSLNATLSSRSGLTLSPNASFVAKSFSEHRSTSAGLSLSTSYNSRTGIKALQLSEQMSFNRYKSLDEAKKYHTKQGSSGVGENVFSSSISFAKPSYLPVIRMPVTNSAYAGHFQVGSGLWGAFGSGEIEVYTQKSEIEDANVQQVKPLVGYLYYQEAINNPNAVMDFTRFNDHEVTANTPVISAPQYSYDVFSIQGEGTGGTMRAYRNDLGYVRDNSTASKDKSFSFGGDIGIPGHYGANVNIVKTPSSIGDWGSGNSLKASLQFGQASGLHENVYFRNPGESSVIASDQFNGIGGTDLVRFKLGDFGPTPSVTPVLERFKKDGYPNGTVTASNNNNNRNKRSQVISFLTAGEATLAGLDSKLKSYNRTSVLNADTLVYTSFDRISDDRKGHHISQINVTEADGKRYVYGIPVYNLKQQDFTFSVENSINNKLGVDPELDRVPIKSEWMTTSSPLLNSPTGGQDGYVQISETPAYAHSFLLSGLLSPDYVDVKGDGITEDDQGNAVKFNYTKMDQPYRWRTPLSNTSEGNLNPGNRSEKKDDKAIVSFGERESWYLHSIESKTMIALFVLGDRNDGKGASNVLGGINASDQSQKKLDEIQLYNKADIKAHGLTGTNAAKPVKTVHFDYDYSLCQGVPDNLTVSSLGRGKLTLKRIYFNFNGVEKQSKNQYLFSYANQNNVNPSYEVNASDRWGSYKPSGVNPISQGNAHLKNKDYPYSIQDVNKLSDINYNASAWALNKILLPSGGQIEVEYESDDYAYVQDRRAADMMQVVGLGNSSDFTKSSSRLYDAPGLNNDPWIDNNYVFVKVSDPCADATEVQQKYLDGVKQLAFRYSVVMPKGEEYLTSYAEIESGAGSVGVVSNDHSVIWLKLKSVGGISPLALTALEYLREQLPGQAFPGYDVSDKSGLDQIGFMMMGWLDGLHKAFTDPIKGLRADNRAKLVNLAKCFVRLTDPDGIKYGGGSRVKSIRLKDNWKKMTGQFDSEYGQEYDYKTTEIFNGIERIISSGVASYEPSIGGEENPFQTIVRVSDKLPLGPTSYGAVEMPVLDAFFPAPSVGYSKVTVRSLAKNNLPVGKKSRSGIGKQVTAFYTAKDFPVYTSNTVLDPLSDRQQHAASTTAFLYKYAFDSRAISQGFLIETNDMHGKLKSQASYAEGDESTMVNYTENFYRNTGKNAMKDLFKFAYGLQGGKIENGNMGIDVELMTDTREFSTKSNSEEIQGQVDLFPVFFPFWIPFIWPVTGTSESIYRAVTTTKVVNYHSTLDSVLVIDKGSKVSTKNLVYDAETGAVIVNRTNNEYDAPIFNTSYPAYWAYSGMGLAYKNIDAIFSGASFSDGRVALSGNPDLATIFESGDELLVISDATPTLGCDSKIASEHQDIVWALDMNKGSTLPPVTNSFIFLDSSGKIFTRSNVKFRIIRSGKRNMLNANVGSVTSMVSPLIIDGDLIKLGINADSKVINASALEFKEKWQVSKDVIKTLQTIPGGFCGTAEVENCVGYLEKNINPYRKGLLGNFRGHRSKVFYGERAEGQPLLPPSTSSPVGALNVTNLSANGFLKDFSLYWDFGTGQSLTPNSSSSKWVWNTESTRFNSRGLELENKNALDIYTAAQYGYDNTLPIAIANNAQYVNMASDGFEDYFFNGQVNNVNRLNCKDKKHIDFSMDNSTVVNAKDAGIAAHTGSYVLSVDANSVAQKYLTPVPNAGNEYSLDFSSSRLKKLDDPGGISQLGGGLPSNVLTYNSGNGFKFSTATTRFDGHFAPYDTLRNGLYQHQFTSGCNFYIEITQGKFYTSHLFLNTYYSSVNPSYSNRVSVELLNIKTLQTVFSDVLEQRLPLSGPSQANFHDTTIYLCPGIYRVTGSVRQDYSSTILYSSDDNYEWTLNGSDSPDYKTLNESDGCQYTVPAPATPEMLHPSFGLVPGKKMLFSVWVRQACTANEACPPSNYEGVKIDLNMSSSGSGNSTVTLKPGGPIIDGWQKIEGAFDIPQSIYSLYLKFNNTTNKIAYFDDIRIHPFNANMKSYVYDPVNLRLVAELDANNYASFYEYDSEGTLIRTKAETKEGIKTINETRSAKQTSINTFQ